MGPYLVDFYAPWLRLVIEVDSCNLDDGSYRKRQDNQALAWSTRMSLNELRK